jgi:amino acid transporter
MMSFDEKNAWVFLTTAVAGYAVYLLLLAAQGAAAYGALLLWTVGGAIVVNIVARIALSIAFPKESRERDARDREVKAFGERVGQAFVVLGALIALVLALVEAPWFWIANAVYLGFVLSAVVGSIASLVAYRKGLPAW